MCELVITFSYLDYPSNKHNIFNIAYLSLLICFSLLILKFIGTML